LAALAKAIENEREYSDPKEALKRLRETRDILSGTELSEATNMLTAALTPSSILSGDLVAVGTVGAAPTIQPVPKR
jgi:hypothetical protein